MSARRSKALRSFCRRERQSVPDGARYEIHICGTEWYGVDSLNYLDIIIILLYFAGMIFLGFFAQRKQKNADDYYVGGRSMGSVKLAALWMAGWIGGSSVIGTSSNAYDMGISAVWYVFTIAVGCVIFAFVMAGPIKNISEKIHNITLPELIAARYDNKCGTMCSVTTILAMIGYTAAQFVAGAAILNVLTGWDLGLCYIIAVVVIVVYVSTGGLLAVTYTDMAQMILLLVGVVVVAVPMTGMKLSEAGLSITRDLPEQYFNLGGWGWSTIVALVISTILSFFTSMDSFTRCIAAKDVKSAKRGTIYAAVAVFVIASASTYLGMGGKLLLPELSSSNNVLAELVLRLLPHGIKGLILVGVLSAIMSTADISILTASASLTRDIYQKYINPQVEEKKLLKMGFVCSLLIGILGAIFGWYNQDIMNILLITFTINSAGLFLPTVCGFFWKRSCSQASLVSMISATIIAVIWYVGKAVSSLAVFQIDALWPAFGVSALLYFVICLCHKQDEEEMEKAEKFFTERKSEVQRV